MKKTLVTLLLACMLVGCGNKQSNEIIGGADEPTGETFNVKDYFEIGE